MCSPLRETVTGRMRTRLLPSKVYLLSKHAAVLAKAERCDLIGKGGLFSQTSSVRSGGAKILPLEPLVADVVQQRRQHSVYRHMVFVVHLISVHMHAGHAAKSTMIYIRARLDRSH
jgi:hypothetical protein